MTAGRWALPPLAVGDMAPDFALPTRRNPRFHFSTAAGRYLLLGFIPRDPAACERALAHIQRHRRLFDDVNVAAFFIVRGADGPDIPPDLAPGQRWFFDTDGETTGRYHREAGGWVLIDPSLRILDEAPFDDAEGLFARLATLPAPGAHAGVALVAPALIVPRVLEPELCRTLIDYYDARGGAVSGVMRDVGGRTVGVVDGMKSRRDVTIEDPDLRRELLATLQRNLIPMIARALQFQATRLERYTVACYDAQEGGFFRAHRDNESLGTAHRKFAASINLNAEDYEGGDLKFPEHGPRTYRAPTGGAVVFACGMQHEATPVTRGRRYAFLPFFYDEEGQQIRERNAALMAQRAAATGAPA